MKTRNIIIILALVSLLAACSNQSFTDDPAAKYQKYTAAELYAKGNKAISTRNYYNAKNYLEALESLYPFGPYAEKGQIDLIYAYYQSGEYASASATAAQYIHVYPRSARADYAYYMKGLADLYSGETWVQRTFPIDMSLRDLTTEKQAFYDFRDLIELFPNSKYTPDARQHMAFLRNMFAKHELKIANYYYKRHAYVAASNRASYLIQHYQHSPQVEPALVLLVKANRALNLPGPANDALRVLQKNFPHSPDIARLQRG